MDYFFFAFFFLLCGFKEKMRGEETLLCWEGITIESINKNLGNIS